VQAAHRKLGRQFEDARPEPDGILDHQTIAHRITMARMRTCRTISETSSSELSILATSRRVVSRAKRLSRTSTPAADGLLAIKSVGCIGLKVLFSPGMIVVAADRVHRGKGTHQHVYR
jgi:hypothetical protein